MNSETSESKTTASSESEVTGSSGSESTSVLMQAKVIRKALQMKTNQLPLVNLKF